MPTPDFQEIDNMLSNMHAILRSDGCGASILNGDGRIEVHVFSDDTIAHLLLDIVTIRAAWQRIQGAG